MSATFQLNMGCLSTGPPDLGVLCIDPALLTRLLASLTTIIATLLALITACVIASIMLCSLAIFILLLSRLPCVSARFL